MQANAYRGVLENFHRLFTGNSTNTTFNLTGSFLPLVSNDSAKKKDERKNLRGLVSSVSWEIMLYFYQLSFVELFQIKRELKILLSQ